MAKKTPQGFPERAADGWPPVTQWEPVRALFLGGIAEAEALTEDAAWLERPLIPAGTSGEFFTFAEHSVGSALLDIALHNAHHLGQVVTLRQLQGRWPPEGGGVTW